MKKTFSDIVVKYGTAICALAVMVAPVAARSCKLLWYESEQPDGLDKFVANILKNNKNDAVLLKTSFLQSVV